MTLPDSVPICLILVYKHYFLSIFCSQIKSTQQILKMIGTQQNTNKEAIHLRAYTDTESCQSTETVK